MNGHTQEVAVRFQDARRTFDHVDGPVVALDGLDLEVNAGEFLVLLGSSGSGKSTALRCIAGLEKLEAGEVWFGDALYSAPARAIHIEPRLRNVGMVFQSYALWPHMTAAKNVAYPLMARGVSNGVAERVGAILEQVQCGELGNRYPSQLSGGQQQRVSLARALVAEPPIVLFDEPLSGLDAQLRTDMRFLIRNLHRSLGFTAVYVTHDQGEALSLASRIALMRNGKIVQIGTPDDLYLNPASPFVANFMGATNAVKLEADANGDVATVSSVEPGDVIEDGASGRRLLFRPTDVLVRIEDDATPVDSDSEVEIGKGVVREGLSTGEYQELEIEMRGGAIRAQIARQVSLERGTRVIVSVPRDTLHAYADGRRSQVPVQMVG